MTVCRSTLRPQVLTTNFFHWLSNLVIPQTMVIPQTVTSQPIVAMPPRPPAVAYDIFKILMRCMKEVNDDNQFHIRLLVLLSEFVNSTKKPVMTCISFTMTTCSEEILESGTIRLLHGYAKFGDLPFFSSKKMCIVGMFRALVLNYDVERGPEGLSIVQKSSKQEVSCTRAPHRLTDMISISNGELPQSVLDLLGKIDRSTAFGIPQLNINEVVWDIVNGSMSNCIGHWVFFIVKFVYDCSPTRFMDKQYWTGAEMLLIRVTQLYLHSQ